MDHGTSPVSVTRKKASDTMSKRTHEPQTEPPASTLMDHGTSPVSVTRKKASGTMSKRKFIQKMKQGSKNLNVWESQHGKFKISKTTSEGNCFFSALFKAGLGFKSEVEARASLVQAIKDDEFLYFHIWNFIVHGKISNDHGLMNGFRDHVKLLAMNGTWARTCDIYMAAVAFKVDLVSIHKTSDTVIRPMNYSHLFKYVDGLKNLIGMVLRRRFIGNVAHGASTVENHFVFLDQYNNT
jgi:hypothetical protein